MKKSIFITIIALLMVTFFSVEVLADTLQVGKEQTALNFRSNPTLKEEAIGHIVSEKDYEIVNSVASYFKCEIDDVKRGKITGWVTAKDTILMKDDKGYYVGGGGCTLRTAPTSKGKTADGYVWPKSRIVKVLDKNIIWYKIKVDGKKVWVSAYYCVVTKASK